MGEVKQGNQKAEARNKSEARDDRDWGAVPHVRDRFNV